MSKQYNEIEKCFLGTDKNIFISAGPGSGKTTTLVKLSKLIPRFKKAIFLSFSKEIVNELREKLPAHIEVCTVHSKGMGVIRQNTNHNAKLSEIKNFLTGVKVIKNKGFKSKKAYNAYVFTVSSIVNLMKLNLVSPDNEEDIEVLCNSYGISITKNEIEDAIKIYNKTEEIDYSDKSSMFDFTDMLYLANKVDSGKFPQYDYVLVDESQDINNLQRDLIVKLKKFSGRFIVVGDEKQTIYSFQGSSLSSFNYFKNLPNTQTLPLSITYRCPKKVVEMAQRFFPNIDAHESNIDGKVRFGNLLEAKDGDFVLCRTNLFLIKAFVHYLENGIKSSIRGKDFQKNLLSLLDKISTPYDIDDLVDEKINDLKERGVVNIQSNPSFVEFQEKIEIIRFLYDRFEKIDAVKECVEKVFSDKSTNGVQLMTMHKSKGLESNSVFILNWSLLPHKNARTDLERYSEKCLQFVALTRAKKELVFCDIK